MASLVPAESSVCGRAALNRRCAISLAGAAGLFPGASACGQSRADLPSPGSLQELAGAAGLFFGAAAFRSEIERQSPVRSLYERECALIVPEAELNWDHLDTDADHQGMEDYAGLVRGMGKALHGHTLLWHRSVPQRVQDTLGEAPDWRIVASHIRSTIARYGRDIRYWEVVNEPLDPGFRDDGLRGGLFLKAFGPDYIQNALEEAAAAAPTAKLLINEYGLDYDMPVERDRRRHMLRLLEKLLRAGAPIHGLGVQGHLDLQKGPFSQRALADFLAEVAGMGLEIVITELDVRERDLVETPAVRDQRVAGHIGQYLDAALEHPAVKGVITWGITDRHSWLELTADDMARFPQAWRDGSSPGLNRGLPYDSDLRPKPMRAAIAAAFQQRARRTASN